MPEDWPGQLRQGTSVAELLESSYLGSLSDTLPVTSTLATPVAGLFADPTTWARSTSPSIRSAASAFATVTSLETFSDLEESALNGAAYRNITHECKT